MVFSLPTADTAVLAAVQRVSTELSELVNLLSSGPSTDVAGTVAAVEAAGRLMDAARVHAAMPLADRVESERLGFATPRAAVATLAQVSERTAAARLALAAAITPDLSITGAPLPPSHPHVAEALTAGRIGVESAVLITRELDRIVHRTEPEAREVAETVMVNLAAGYDPAGETLMPPVSLDYLTPEIRAFGALLDPDGARPREERAARNRKVWVGKANDDGLMPFGGLLDPVLGQLLLRLLEAWRRSPRFATSYGRDEPDSDDTETEADGTGMHDTRTPDQLRHDAFGELLTAAAAHQNTPQLNGHPVTVLVTVTQADLTDPDGRPGDPIGTLAGSPFPLSRSQVQNLIDANGYRTVTLNPDGAITGISSPERCFTPTMTLAIAARDGYRCSTPGCTSPHTALQVHHVIPSRDHGPTHTDNGILQCYGHHKNIDTGPWKYQMINGVPHVRGPGIPDWRPTSRTRPSIKRSA